MYETLVYKKEAGLGIITLNQPNVLNALNAKAYEELYEVAEGGAFVPVTISPMEIF